MEWTEETVITQRNKETETPSARRRVSSVSPCLCVIPFPPSPLSPPFPPKARLDNPREDIYKGAMKSLYAVTGVAAVLVVFVVFLEQTPVPAASPDPPASGQAVARTPWGEPDLQGIWTNNFDTPLERPARYKDREFFTEQERAAIDNERARILGLGNRRRDPKGSEQDVGGAYDQTVFLTHRHMGRRTSMISDPPDGRLPAFTPEAKQRMDEARTFHL